MDPRDPRLRARADAAQQQQSNRQSSSSQQQSNQQQQQQQQQQISTVPKQAQLSPSRNNSSGGQVADPRELSRQGGQSRGVASQRRRPVHAQRPSGPPKRNKQFQEQEKDCFHPRYALSYMHPYVPVEPKLFTYRLNTDSAASKYEFSCVELNQPHQIYVDYNMGMRIDLVDKEKYQVNARQQRQMMLGSEATNTKQEEMTDKMIEDIKMKLLSSRDKYILSNKDTLPDFEPVSKSANKSAGLMRKQNSSLSGDLVMKKESSQGPTMVTENQHRGGEKQSTSVLTGQTEKRNLAIKQINETFSKSNEIQVGTSKMDQRGRAIKGVTALSVKDITPMDQAELLKLSMVINDDDLSKATTEAGTKNNGHLLYSFKDKNGDTRQSFYSLQAQEEIPDELKSFIVGKKRTAIEAGFSSERDRSLCNQAIQLQHVRDYAFHEIKGGSKGEQADYLLYDTGNALQFLPITSKVKLNKKRKYSAVNENEAQPVVNRPETSHIVMAARAYSKDEEKQFNDLFGRYGTQRYRVAQSMTPFEGREDLKDADRRVADLLKEMFRHHLPKIPEPTSMDEDGDEFADKDLMKKESDDDLFGKYENNQENAAQIKQQGIKKEQQEATTVKQEQVIKQDKHQQQVVMSDDESGDDDIF